MIMMMNKIRLEIQNRKNNLLQGDTKQVFQNTGGCQHLVAVHNPSLLIYIIIKTAHSQLVIRQMLCNPPKMSLSKFKNINVPTLAYKKM